jgi:hypothetical protein
MNDQQQTELKRLEDEVRKGEDAGITARWASGRELLTLRSGKRLPDGVRVFLTAQLGISASEVSKRMQFAEKYATDEALCVVVTQFGSWHRIVHEALVTKKGNPRAVSAAERLTKAIDAFEAMSLTDDESEALKRAAQRLLDSLSFFADRRAA